MCDAAQLSAGGEEFVRGANAVPRRHGWTLTQWLGLVVSIAVAWLVVWSPPARAAGVSDAECMECHGDKSITRSTGNPPTSVYVDTLVVHRSVHATLSCSKCHLGIVESPHAERVPTKTCEQCHTKQSAALRTGVHRKAHLGDVKGCRACHGSDAHQMQPAKSLTLASCESCHRKEVAAYSGSIHVRKAVMKPGKAACAKCHGATHTLLPHTDPMAPTARAKVVEMCAKCHGDRELMMKRKIAIPAAYELFRQSVHGRSKKDKAAICSDCHTVHDVRRAGDPLSSIYRTAIPATCGQCHKKELAAYKTSVHGSALERGIVEAPVCTDCHGEHLIRGPKDDGSPVGKAGVIKTCSKCHEAQGIRETYGLAAGRLSTYEDSYHGLAARGGSPVVANCASCHGVHDILPSKDPRSRINERHLAVTCGKCHPGIGKTAQIGRVHEAMADSKNPVLFWVRKTYLWLIAVVLGGMAFHNFLDFTMKMRRRFRASLLESEHEEEDEALAGAPPHVRMTLLERIQHWMLQASFFTLVYTGFALKFPESWLFSWLARAEHGYAVRSLVHRGAAIVMVAVTLMHCIYLLTPRGRKALVAGLPRLSDFVEAGQNFAYFLGLRKHPPRFDRFNYVEKAEYWALVWGTVVMTVTGVALWFENDTLRRFGKLATDLSTVVHYYEAWLAFAAIIIWHVYHTVFNPDVYPMDWTWITGKVSARRQKHERPREWERDHASHTQAAEQDPPTGGTRS